MKTLKVELNMGRDIMSEGEENFEFRKWSPNGVFSLRFLCVSTVELARSLFTAATQDAEKHKDFRLGHDYFELRIEDFVVLRDRVLVGSPDIKKTEIANPK
jgi:hypothetical protein